MFLVELEVCILTRVAVLAAPDLQRGPRVADERDRCPGAATRRNAIGRVGRARLGSRHRRGRLVAWRLERHEISVEEDRRARRDEMRVGDEILEPVRREQLLDAGPDPAYAAAVAPARRGPLVARPIRAFRQADTAWRLAEVAAVGRDGGAELEGVGVVVAEERGVAVARGVGNVDVVR